MGLARRGVEEGRRRLVWCVRRDDGGVRRGDGGVRAAGGGERGQLVRAACGRGADGPAAEDAADDARPPRGREERCWVRVGVRVRGRRGEREGRFGGGRAAGGLAGGCVAGECAGGGAPGRGG